MLDHSPSSDSGLTLGLCSDAIPGSAVQPYAVPGIELGSVLCKAGALAGILSLQPESDN